MQNQFRQVVKYSIPSSQDSFEDEIDGLFFSVGYGRIFMKGRFFRTWQICRHVSRWQMISLEAPLCTCCCSMMSNVAGHGGCPGNPGRTPQKILYMVVWAWLDDVLLKGRDMIKRYPSEKKNWTLPTEWPYIDICICQICIFHHFPWWPLSFIFGAARITFIILWGAKLRCRVVLGRTLGGLEGWWWGCHGYDCTHHVCVSHVKVRNVIPLREKAILNGMSRFLMSMSWF